MKKAKYVFSILALAMIAVSCGKSDAPILPAPVVSNPYPYGPGFPGGGYYNGGNNCLPQTLVSNYHQYSVTWPGDYQSFTLGNVCPNVRVTMKADSDEDLHVVVGGQEELFTRAELDAGKTFQFSSSGYFYFYCDSCGDLDVDWDIISIAY